MIASPTPLTQRGTAARGLSSGVGYPHIRFFIAADLPLEIDRDGDERTRQLIRAGLLEAAPRPGLPERDVLFHHHGFLARADKPTPLRQVGSQPWIEHAPLRILPADILVDRNMGIFALRGRPHRRD